MKRKIFAIILCLIVCLSTVAGCNLVTRNDEKYFEAVVCTISYVDGTKDEITKRELLTGYNSYGYNYQQNYGYSQQEAVEQTLNTIVNQHLTIKAVKNFYEAQKNDDDYTGADKGLLFTDNETTYLWDQTYDAVFSNLKDFYYEISGTSDKTGTEDSSSDSRVYQQYNRGYHLENQDGKIVLKSNTPATTTRYEYPVRKFDNKVLDFKEDESKQYMYDCIVSLFDGTSKEQRNWRSAFNKYVSEIEENFSYKHFASDKDCFMFEMNRIYEIVRDNYIVEKYTEIFNRLNHQDADEMNISVDDILKRYSSKVRADFQTYKDNPTSFNSSILTDTANMDYIYEGTGESKFFNIAYMRFDFNDDQKKAYSEANNISDVLGDRKETELQKVYDSMTVTMKDGDEKEYKVPLTVFREMIENSMSGFEFLQPITEDDVSEEDLTKSEMTKTDYVKYYNNKFLPNRNQKIAIERAEYFRDNFFNPYNSDTTYVNSERCAVAGIDNSGEAIVSDTFSNNDDAKDAIVKLYNQGNAKVGDISQLVKTSDGMYLFFYAGEVKNLFGVTKDFDISKDPENIKILAGTRLNIFSNKTYLDALVEEMTTDNFSTFQNMDIANLRSTLVVEKGIHFYGENLKDLY